MSEPREPFRVRRSVFVRLVAVMTGVAVSLLVIVGGFFIVTAGPSLSTPHHLYRDYALTVAAAPPSLEKAKAIAKRLDIQIRYEGPEGGFSTSPDLPTIDEARRLRETAPRAAEYYLADGATGGKYLFVWGYEARMSAVHLKLLWLTLGSVLAVVLVAHAAISRFLRPLRPLQEGVARLSEGDLDIVLPAASRDEFGALTAAFNGMVARVREMLRARDRLLLDVSHELRSPLTRMKVALELLPDSEKKARMSADVAEMETMITELLEMERLRDGRAGIRLQRRDLVPILREAAEALAETPPGVRFVSAAAELPSNVDEQRVRTVLRNLLGNAVKYSLPDSKPVELTAAREGDAVVVRVRDDGPGIPEADLAAVFEPFFRVDRSRSKKTGGYGLGLSICKQIMEAHGGDITAERNPGRGVTFVVRFPAGGV